MTLEAITRAELANDLSLLDSSGQVIEYTVANLLRVPLSRWGLSPKRAILKSAKDQLRAGGVDDVSCISKVLDRLVTLGECSAVNVGNEVYIAPAQPRWIPVGDGVGAYLGVTDLPRGVYRVPTVESRNIVQRICVATDEDVAQLHIAGIREVSLSEWLSPFDYHRHAARRMRRPVKSGFFNLKSFWDMLESALVEEGLPLSVEAEVRAVTGEPGAFFGRYNAPTPEGRWSSNPSDGVWCAFRKGYSEAHWHPTIISVDGQDIRALDLYDQDEWRWALLARGKKSCLEEVIHVEADSVRVTFPIPCQLAAAMDLLGDRTASWAWTLNPGAPNVREFVD